MSETSAVYEIDITDKPVFRFGNGQHLQASSRVDIHNTSIGSVSFYVLGGEACLTPPLMGGKTLRQLGAVLAYQNNLLLYRRQDPQMWFAVKMHSHASNHVSIDLMESATEMKDPGMWFVSESSGMSMSQHDATESTSAAATILMMSNVGNTNLSGQLTSLAQRLRALRQFSEHGTSVSSMCGRRPTPNGLSMPWSAPTKAEAESVCSVDDVPRMRTTNQLCVEETYGGCLQVDGTSPASDELGTEGDRERDGREPGDGEGCHWKGHGVEGHSASEGADRKCLHQHDISGVPEAYGLHGEHQRRSGQCDGHDRCQGQGQDQDQGTVRVAVGSSIQAPEGERAGQLGSGEVPKCSPGICAGQDSGTVAAAVPQARCQEGEDSPGATCQRQAPATDTSGLRDQVGRRGLGCQLGGEAAGKPLSGLWTSLKSLQNRMVGGICHQASNQASTGDKTMKSSAMDFEGSRLRILGSDGVPVEYSGCRTACVGCHSPGLTTGASGFKGSLPDPDANPVEKQLPVPGPGGGKRKGVVPYIARKLASNMAILSAMILIPFRSLMSQITTSVDFVEVACAPTSSLSAKMEELGFHIQRVNFKEGFDLDQKSGTQKLHDFIREKKPRHTWVSLKCTRLSSLNNLTQRDEHEEAAFQKRQARDLKRADEVVQALESALINGDDISWEWPTGATKGWKSRAIQRLQKLSIKHHRHLYWCHFHGCAYGLSYKGFAVQKGWTVATTCREVWLGLQRRCPGDHEHLHCRGAVAQASSYYPTEMVKSVTKAITASWQRVEEKAGTSLGRDLSIHLLDAGKELEHLDNMTGLYVAQECQEMLKFEAQARQEQPEILALTRNRYPAEMPSGKQLEMIKSQMLRVHKAAGHPSFANLQRLLRARQAPPWAVALAGQIKCPDCVEAKQPPSAPVASLHDTPGLLEIIGADIFESEHGGHKFKFMLIRDRASGLVMVEFLQRYGGDGEDSAWEPNSDTVIKVFAKWMMHNPSPKWILTDSATYFTSQRMMDYAGMSGIGLLTTPAEAHHMLGAEENAIKLIKNAATRLLKDEVTMEVELAYTLAAHGHNSSINSTGFSPFQWSRGSSAPMENMPIGINPRRAFDGMLKLKEKARIAFEVESAKARLSKLNNTVPQKVQVFKPGMLVMLWRQRQKPGKTGGVWIGPVRVLLQEGGTIWTATGATLIRARAVQLRRCTNREELQATLEGTAVLRMPVTLESLLQNFTGRHFADVTGDVPSMEQLQDDVQGAEVLVEPPTNVRPDVWSFRQDGGRRFLVRVHHLPRLSLFSPQRMTSCPVPESDLSGRRLTKLKGMSPDAKEVVIEDDYKTSEDPHKSLQDRWKGETWLEMKAEAAQSSAAKKTRKGKAEAERKRKAEADLPTKDEVQEGEEDEVPDQVGDSGGAHYDPPEGAALPSVPAISPLTTALRAGGADAVDGVPAKVNVSSGTTCPVDACVLPGGHYGPHEDEEGHEFTWNPYQGRQNLGADEAAPESSEDSDSSAELLIEPPDNKIYSNNAEIKHVLEKQAKHTPANESFYALEIEIGPSDLKYLSKNTDGWSIWLSKKMLEKGKEKRWTQLDLEEKKRFDLAQAKELSNVLSSKALRSLTSQEMSSLEPSSVAQMRWVLTVKSDGTAKARLVILGFQMSNITELDTAAPTMGRVGRYLLLSLCANKGYRLKAGDVTSAFLQADENLEQLEMTVWAPAELAVLFGADPKNPVLPLRVCKAFYGLVQSPRCWFMDVSSKMIKHGWRQLLSD